MYALAITFGVEDRQAFLWLAEGDSRETYRWPFWIQVRNLSDARIRSLGWEPNVSLGEGKSDMYRRIELQVKAARDEG